jgi:hypothetical protein
MPSYRIVPPPRPHSCALPDAKDFEVGTVIACTGKLYLPEPPMAHRAKKYRPPQPVECGQRWRVGRTWFWRDHVWRSGD